MIEIVLVGGARDGETFVIPATDGPPEFFSVAVPITFDYSKMVHASPDDIIHEDQFLDRYELLRYCRHPSLDDAGRYRYGRPRRY